MAKSINKKDSQEDRTENLKEEKKVSTFQRLRNNHKFRLWFIGVLIVIVGILFVFWAKMRIVLAVALIALLGAFGLEASQNDFDLGTLLKTKSFDQSKVSRDDSGNILYDKMGNITTNASEGKKADEYNCDDFMSQPESQSFYQRVGGKGNDVNRLDGDKDGDACESLPQDRTQ